VTQRQLLTESTDQICQCMEKKNQSKDILQW
jgi:hypothetical protein